ncbi:MAG: hypothetical protein FJ161_02935 [Gammaproteobacteria bacterium]|nr:hypothetical protein [Gammaproteobacteria bacterium]
MKTLTDLELTSLYAGIQSGQGFDHYQSKPKVGMKEDIITGLAIEAICAICRIIYDKFFGSNNKKDSDEKKENSARYGFSMSSRF